MAEAERFIPTTRRGSADARARQTSDQRKTRLPESPHMANWHRPHASLNAKPPISRLTQTLDTRLRFHR